MEYSWVKIMDGSMGRGERVIYPFIAIIFTFRFQPCDAYGVTILSTHRVIDRIMRPDIIYSFPL